jgi:hypothetical protein
MNRFLFFAWKPTTSQSQRDVVRQLKKYFPHIFTLIFKQLKMNLMKNLCIIILLFVHHFCIAQTNGELVKLNLKNYTKLNYFLDIRYEPSSFLYESYTKDKVRAKVEEYFSSKSIIVNEVQNRYTYPVLEVITFPDFVTTTPDLKMSQTDFRVYDKINGNIVLVYYMSWDCYSFHDITKNLWKILDDNLNAFSQSWNSVH